MEKKTRVISVVNQKGGTGKTTTCANLGIALAQKGQKVLLIDGDPQGSLTISLGYPMPDEIPLTLSDVLKRTVNGEENGSPLEGILKHREGVDLMPANMELSGLEVSLVNVMSRESILKQYTDSLRGRYDEILIDCMPSLGMLTVNALTASDSILIPVQSQYLSAKGLEQLMQTVRKVKRQLNPSLRIEGILLTMTDNRTNYSREVAALIRRIYGGKIRIFDSEIPRSVRAAETSAEGKSIFLHDPKGKAAEAYEKLSREVMERGTEKNRRKYQAEESR